MNDDYVEVYECKSCNKGYIAKTKDNTSGFKFSSEYLCKFCLLKSKKGKLIYLEYGDDFLPAQFKEGVQICSSDKEYEIWSKIWFKK